MASIFDWAKLVVGVGSGVANIYQYKKQSDSANKALKVQRRAVGAQEDLLKQIEGQFDDESYRRAVGIMRYFLGGGQAKDLNIPGIKHSFDQIDESVAAEIRQIDTLAREQQEMITDTTRGGEKLQLLADLAMKTQDLKGAALRKAQDQKKTLNIQLTNQWFTNAMNFANQMQSSYVNQAGQISRGIVASAQPQLDAAVKALEGREKGLKAIGNLIGRMGELYKEDKGETPTIQTKTFGPVKPGTSAPQLTLNWPPSRPTNKVEEYYENENVFGL